MLDVFFSNQFKKDYKKAVKRHCDVEDLFKVIELFKINFFPICICHDIFLLKRCLICNQRLLTKVKLSFPLVKYHCTLVFFIRQEIFISS